MSNYRKLYVYSTKRKLQKWRCINTSVPCVSSVHLTLGQLLKRAYELKIYSLIKGCLVISFRSRPKVFCKKDVLKNFAKFAGKHLCQTLFLNKVSGLKRIRCISTQVFSCEFCEIFKKTYFYRTPLVAASAVCLA